MRYPIYDAGRYPPPGVSLVDAYITLIGSNERDNQAEIDELPRGDTRRASFQIGRACLLGKRNPSESRKLVRAAHRELDPKHPEAHLRRIHSYRTLARMIELRDDPNTVNNLRRNLHRQAVDGLAEAAKQSQQFRYDTYGSNFIAARGIAGRRAENRTLAALNRWQHPWFMAVPSLQHHDNSRRKGRKTPIGEITHYFDIALVESLPVSVSSESSDSQKLSKLQIKSECFGFCSLKERDSEDARENFEEVLRPSYSSDVTLISGCCDFQQGETFTKVDPLFMDEFSGKLGEDNVLALDAITTHVFSMATNGEAAGRCGTYDLEVAGQAPSTI